MAGKFKTGAIPTPRYKLAAAVPHKIRGTTPTQVISIPSFIEMWLNDQDGDCVTAEEGFAKAYYSVFCGQPETKITDATVLAFCNKYDFLNGANLTDVMDKMISDGFQQDSGYKNGAYAAVNYADEPTLQNALSQGPVKIGIDASALPSGAGNGNGWSGFGGTPGQFTSEDHCVSLCGYGSAAALFAALNTAVPAGAPSGVLYLLYTWSSIGVVDHAWIMSTCGEAWLRSPTTVGVAPAPVPVPPAPTPAPTPTPAPPIPTPSTLLALVLSALNGVNAVFGWIPGVTAAITKLEAFFNNYLNKKKISAPKLTKVNTGTIQIIVDDMFAAANMYFVADPTVLMILAIAQPIVDQLIANLP
jgi:hypothetical protein